MPHNAKAPALVSTGAVTKMKFISFDSNIKPFSMPAYFHVIIVCKFDGGREQFLKYRNIAAPRLKRFWLFASQIPDLHHVNFYDKNKPKGKNFVKQVSAADILSGQASV
jgi:hypothetical protein